MSKRSSFFRNVLTAFSIDVINDTSISKICTFSFSLNLLIFATVSLGSGSAGVSSAFLHATYTVHPFLARLNAVSYPMPVLAPVMIATLPGRKLTFYALLKVKQ